MRRDLLKSWLAGLALTALILALRILGTHTWLQLSLLPLFLPLMIPLGLLPLAAAHRHAGIPSLTLPMYSSMVIWGSVFYGVVLLPFFRYRTLRRQERRRRGPSR
jgi:hypothetical protein